MKVIVDRAALMEALNLISGVVVSRTPKPVLLCVKLTAAQEGEGGLSLAATDLEAFLKCQTQRVEVGREPRSSPVTSSCGGRAPDV